MTTPINARRTLPLIDRFWSLAPSPGLDDMPEPRRSLTIVRSFLLALDHVSGQATGSPRGASTLLGWLREAELDGELSYASPEQIAGETMDQRSAVFSLGVLLFERLTGRHPFGAEHNRPRRIERIRKGEMGSGVNSFPTVSRGLRSVLIKSMSPFAEERWSDIGQLRDRLALFLEHEAPAPRLPGTATAPPPAAADDSDVDDTPGGGATRIVRRPTDFGRDLMAAVARHERTAPPAPPAGTRKPDEVRAQRGTAPPPVPTLSERPRPRNEGAALEFAFGMFTLERRPEDRGVDPHGETVVANLDGLEGSDMMNDVVDLHTPPPRRSPARTVPPTPPPRSTSAIATMAPVVEALTAAPRAARDVDPNDTAQIDLRPGALLSVAPRSRTAMVAIASAAVGAAVAAVAILALSGDSAEAPSPATAADTGAAGAVTDEARDRVTPAAEAAPAAPTAVATPAAAARPAAAAPAAQPAAAAAAAPALTTPADTTAMSLGDRVAAQVAACFAPARRERGARFAISLIVGADGKARKAYYGDPAELGAAERRCVTQSLKNADVAPAGIARTVELRLHIAATTAHGTQHGTVK